MIKIAFSLFISGIIFGTGPCLASCGPILISYIAAFKKGPLQAFFCWLIFSVSRIFVYVILGALAGIIGGNLYQSYYWEMPGFVIWFLGGIFICMLGILTMLGKNIPSKICQRLQGIFIKKDIKSIVTLGIIIGLFPCAPLIGIISYVSMLSIHSYQGIILMLSFGLGTMISPLLILSLGTGIIPKFNILQNEKIYEWFGRIAGFVLFLLGTHILVKIIIGYLKGL